MYQLTNKINNNHHKTSSDCFSKQKLEKNITSSNCCFKPNATCIKINKISNSKGSLIYMMNQKFINGRSFDKDLHEKKMEIKNFIKSTKNKKNKEYEKNSLELESKDEISTNNFTENFYNNVNNYYTEHKTKDNNNLNIKINETNFYPNSNANVPESEIKNLLNSNNTNISKIITNLNLTNSNNTKKNKKNENIENKVKNGEDKKHIRVNKKNKKGLYINNSNRGKKSLNLNFIINSNNKKINITKRKYSNLTEENRLNMGIGGLVPLKSKTQNYINLNIKHFNSNQKLKGNSKKVNDNFNNSCENNKISTNLLSSKKRLFSENIDNNIQKTKVNQGNKKIIGINNIKFEQKNVLLLTDIFSTKKILKIVLPKNKNIDILKSYNKDNNNKNIFNDDNHHTITQNQEKNKEECYTERIERNKDHKELNETKDLNNKKDVKLNLLIKKNIISKKKIMRNINLSNKNGINTCKNKEGQISFHKDNLNISKKKKNSHNNISNMNSSHKQLKLETSYQEKYKNKFIEYNNPLINKVHIFEIGKTKLSKNNNLESYNNNDMSYNKNNNNFLENIIFNNSSQQIINNIDFTPKKKKLTDIIQSNIKLNKNNNKDKEKNILNNEYFENNATPINHKLDFIQNFKNIKEQNNDDIKNKNIKSTNNKNESKQDEKEFCEMVTPVLLNTPKLTERIFDAKLNLFEKIKNMKTNYNLDKNKNKEEISSENSEIIFEENEDNSISSTKNNKEKKIKNNSNNSKKDKTMNKSNNIKNSIKYLLLLDENCLLGIFRFLDMEKINFLCTMNKKCFIIFKPIINKIIKGKILNYYLKSPIIYINKIKLSLMTYSPLSKLSPLLLHKKFVDLLLENNQRYDQEIKKDLTRTLPDNFSFKKGNINYNKLYHLLTVYSLYNQKIGYVQGINFLAANIIILMEKEKEEKSLMFLDGFLKKFEFENLIGLGMGSVLDKYLNQLGNNLSKYCPEIVIFLNNSKLCHEFFSTNWILTLFANSMESEYLFIIWDFLIIFGWKFLMCFIVSVLDLNKKEIIDEEQNNLTFFMKNILRNKKFNKNFNAIIDKSFSLMDKEYNFQDN